MRSHIVATTTYYTTDRGTPDKLHELFYLFGGIGKPIDGTFQPLL